MSRILVFENGANDQQFLQSCLEAKFETHIFSDARNCIEKTLEIEPDLILMDLALDSINVIEARSQLRRHRATSKIPVLLLSTPQEFEAKCCGTKFDCVSKPVQANDLLKQIEIKLSRANATDSESAHHVSAGDLSVDVPHAAVFLGPPTLALKSRLQIELSPTEIDLLTLFIRNEGNVLCRAEIQHALGLDLGDRGVDSLVFQLRRELKPVAHYFKTVYGKGYRFQSGPRPQRPRAR